MKIDLIYKKALVGASSQGIGYAIALELANCGASVVLTARNEEKLKERVSNLPITNSAQQHSYLVVDYSDLLNYKRTITEFLQGNPIDILIN
ncbi:MAG: SDR family NAD(P)-dependent oxidoreductase, partial [Hymenobacter sp.]